MLDDRSRAIAAHVSHGDSALLCGGEIDAVRARTGDRDQLELECSLETLARELDLIDEHDPRIREALDDLLIVGQRIEADIGRRLLEARGVEVAVGYGFVIEE